MRLRLTVSVITALLILGASSSRSEVSTGVTLGTGYHGNLFNDSNSMGDTYTSAGIGLKYYPSASVQIVTRGVYNAFSSYGDLSNLTGDLSVTIVPTTTTSPLSVTLSGAVTGRGFGELYKSYNQAGATIGMNASYRVAPWAHLLSSVSYLNTTYTNSDFGSSSGYDLASGMNFSILGSNAIALRVEYSHRSFDQPVLIPLGDDWAIADQNESEPFGILGGVLRYSRPLGERTELNLSVGQRWLLVEADYAVLGYTIDYLSPWSDLWEGTSLSGGLRHFFPSQVTTELSFSYSDKNFVEVFEFDDNNGEPYWREDRDDRLTTLSLTLSRPVTLQSGNQLTPLIHLGYRKNQSSTGFFDYEDMSASISLSVDL